MKKLLKTVGLVIKGLVEAGVEFTSSDDFENDFSPIPHDVEGHEVSVGDDGERDQWEVILRVTPKEGVDVHQVVSKVLGPPVRTFDNPGRKITNYEPKKVLVVVGDDEIQFFQDYKKV